MSKKVYKYVKLEDFLKYVNKEEDRKIIMNILKDSDLYISLCICNELIKQLSKSKKMSSKATPKVSRLKSIKNIKIAQDDCLRKLKLESNITTNNHSIKVDGRLNFLLKFTKCGICGEFLNPNTTNKDHIVPRSMNGAHHPLNLMHTHTKCNCNKKNIYEGDSYDVIFIESVLYALDDEEEMNLVRDLLLPSIPDSPYLPNNPYINKVNSVRNNYYYYLTAKQFEWLKSILSTYKINIKDIKPRKLPTLVGAIRINDIYSEDMVIQNKLREHLINKIFS